MSNIASKETLEQGINMIAPVAVKVSEPCDAWGRKGGGFNQVGDQKKGVAGGSTGAVRSSDDTGG